MEMLTLVKSEINLEVGDLSISVHVLSLVPFQSNARFKMFCD